MDYEKKYKEALERAEEFYNDKDIIRYANAEGMLEEIFPELKESEDEKVRKYLIRYIDNTMKSSTLKSKLLAWLENIPYTIDHEKREGFHLGYKAGLEKQGEQKPAWSEEDEENRNLINTILWESVGKHLDVPKYDSIITQGDVADLTQWLKSLKQRIAP